MKRKKPNYWTKERCHEEALKYETRGNFCDNSKNEYNAALRNGWLDEICNHMKFIKHNKGYWTKDQCQKEALKYINRSDFNKKSNGAYDSAYKNKWLDEICSHMKIKGNKFNRCVYVYEFSDNFIYVGLTFNINQRHLQHLKRGPVFDHIQINNDYKLKKLTDYIPVNDAKEKEIYYIKKYKDDNYNILNSDIGGALGGGTRKWTFEKCIDIAKECKTKSEYKIKNKNSYKSAIRNGWLDDICEKCKLKSNIKKPNGYWTKERCILESEKYDSLKIFKINSRSAYLASERHDWIKEIIEIRKCY